MKGVFILIISMINQWPMVWHDPWSTSRNEAVNITCDSLLLQYKKPVHTRLPCIIGSDSLLFIGDEQGVFYCLSAFNGIDKWSYNTMVSNWILTPALNSTGTVVYFVNIYDPSWHGHVYACSTGNGTLYWHYVAPEPGSWITTSPIVNYSTGIIYLADCSNPDGHIRGLNPDGTVFFNYAVPDIGGEEDFGVHAIDKVRNRYYVSGWNMERRVLAFDLSGIYQWSYDKGNIGCQGISVDSSTGIIFASGDKLYALDAQGNLIWSKYLGARPAHPAIGSNNTVVVVAADTIFSFFFNGNLNWKLANPQSVKWIDVALDSCNNVCATTADGRIYIINSDGTIRFSVKVSDSSLSSPVIAEKDGCSWIFVTDGDTLYALSAFLSSSEDNFKRKLYTGKSTDFNFSIYDVTGRISERFTSFLDVKYKMSRLSPGIYFIKFKREDCIQIKKLIKLK